MAAVNKGTEMGGILKNIGFGRMCDDVGRRVLLDSLVFSCKLGALIRDASSRAIKEEERTLLFAALVAITTVFAPTRSP